jgi:AmmeMemoRadiSam system protein B
MFYPDDPQELRTAVVGLLSAHRAAAPAPKALIVPHAGYVYSGAVAAAGFARLAPEAHRITRIVLFGPAHRVAVRGLAAPGADAFATPLGPVAVDRDAIAAVAELPGVVVDDAPHALEHSLEVQLPFLQRVLGDFKIAPFAVGDADPAEVAAVMDRLWGGPETRIVVSSDLSHYLSSAEARRIDAATAAAIEQLDPAAIGEDQACGRLPIAGLLRVAQERRLNVERLALCNSGDTAGPKSRVVGYGAWAFG